MVQCEPAQSTAAVYSAEAHSPGNHCFTLIKPCRADQAHSSGSLALLASCSLLASLRLVKVRHVASLDPSVYRRVSVSESDVRLEARRCKSIFAVPFKSKLSSSQP